MSKLVIGLCGPEGAGKTTAGKIIAEEFGATIIPFAKPLKGMLETLGVARQHLYGTPEEKLEALDVLCGKSARWALQALGTEWGRDLIGADIWVNAWKQAVECCSSDVVVGDDLRFVNEAAAIHSLGGKVICILRPEADDRAGQSAHRSQEYWKLPWDAHFFNDGSIDVLRDCILNTLASFKKNVAA